MIELGEGQGQVGIGVLEGLRKEESDCQLDILALEKFTLDVGVVGLVDDLLVPSGERLADDLQGFRVHENLKRLS